MRKIAMLLVCLILITQNAFAADIKGVYRIPDTDYVKIKADGMVGIIDMFGNVILDNEWYDIEYINEQMALGEKNDINYLIDLTNGMVNAVEADEICRFSEGLACARFGDKWGYIDRNGKLMIDAVYDLEDDLYWFEPLQDYGYWFENGIACVRKGEKCGYINTDGEVVIPIEYDYGSCFYECGLAEVWIENKKRLINRDGEFVGDMIWDTIYLENEHDGKIIVVKDGKEGLIDTNGEILLEPEWDDIYFYKDEFVAIKDDDEKTHFIARNGIRSVLIEENLWGNTYKVGVLGADGNYIVEPIYDTIMEIGMLGEYEKNGYLLCGLNDKCGVINPDGELVTDIIYDSITGYGCGLICVKKDGKYGYIDGNGETVIDCIYSETGDFENGYAIVKRGGYYGIIDTEGNTVLDFVYDDIRAYVHGNALVRKGTSWSLVDKNGNIINIDID